LAASRQSPRPKAGSGSLVLAIGLAVGSYSMPARDSRGLGKEQDCAASRLVFRRDAAHVVQELMVDAIERLPEGANERLLGIGNRIEPRAHVLDQVHHF
jgi:hypothetical protein